MTRVRLRFKGGPEMVILLRPEVTPTVSRLLENLPFESIARRWGDEIYFEAPFHSVIETDARAEMNPGDLAYWPDGDAIAVFFGPTPASRDARPVAYSPCNIVGVVQGELGALKGVRAGTEVDMCLD